MFTSFRYMSWLVPALTASFILAALSFSMNELRTSDASYNMQTSIAVEGTAKVSAKPDVASFTLTLRTEANTQGEAQTKTSEREQAILTYLAEQGVEEKDIKTGYYDLSPRYEYEMDTKCNTSFCPGKQVQVGYQVSQTITVTVRNLDKAGELVAGVGARGAENVSQLTYKVDDPSKLKEEAIVQAIKDANTKAKARAKALGVRLGKLQSFYETTNGMPFALGGSESVTATMKSDVSSTPTLPSGESEYEVRVSVQYGIR